MTHKQLIQHKIFIMKNAILQAVITIKSVTPLNLLPHDFLSNSSTIWVEYQLQDNHLVAKHCLIFLS